MAELEWLRPLAQDIILGDCTLGRKLSMVVAEDRNGISDRLARGLKREEFKAAGRII